MDDLSFKVFFAFQGSVRLLLSEAPRQVINAVMLHALWFLRTKGKGNIFSKFFSGYSKTTTLLTVTASFSVLVFAGSLLLLLFAVVCYVPLYFFKVRGNLTNYVCHRVNKRILEIVKREARRRALHSVKLEKAAISDPVKNRITDRAGKTIPQPTLPKFSLDVALDEEIDLVALKERLRKEGTESFETEKGDDGDEKVDDDDIELVLECPSPIESTDNESVDSFEITVIPPDSPPLLEEDAPSQYHTNDLLSGTRKKTRHRKHKRRRSSPEKEVETPTPEITVPRIARRRLGRMPSLEMDEVSDTIDYYLPEARAPLETDRSPV
ncbi:hypothetical protein DFP72DRAFT_597659 [Ephemerocybe angulata]|uniref:Uncharacterized protein n=1 Tax=Ephemerocybe angulata TaxID=980116 RepID=A0A8H6MDS8_9AGAR|nr:hypothetical protein DFP72DRAFT_597659 [Tulosesus angulatus]